MNSLPSVNEGRTPTVLHEFIAIANCTAGPASHDRLFKPYLQFENAADGTVYATGSWPKTFEAVAPLRNSIAAGTFWRREPDGKAVHTITGNNMGVLCNLTRAGHPSPSQ
jgi:hypothetical protein